VKLNETCALYKIRGMYKLLLLLLLSDSSVPIVTHLSCKAGGQNAPETIFMPRGCTGFRTGVPSASLVSNEKNQSVWKLLDPLRILCLMNADEGIITTCVAILETTYALTGILNENLRFLSPNQYSHALRPVHLFTHPSDFQPGRYTCVLRRS